MGSRVGQEPYIKAYYNDRGNIVGVEDYIAGQSIQDPIDTFLDFDKTCAPPKKVKDGGSHKPKVSIFVDQRPACMFCKSKTEADLLFKELQKIVAFSDVGDEDARTENLEKISDLVERLYTKYEGTTIEDVALIFIEAIKKFGNDHVSQARIIFALFLNSSTIAEIVFHADSFEQARRLLKGLVIHDGDLSGFVFGENGLRFSSMRRGDRSSMRIGEGIFYNLSLLKPTRPTKKNYLGLTPLFYKPKYPIPLVIFRGETEEKSYSLDQYTAGVLDENLAAAAEAAANITITGRSGDPRDERVKRATAGCEEDLKYYITDSYPQCDLSSLKSELSINYDIRGEVFYTFELSDDRADTIWGFNNNNDDDYKDCIAAITGFGPVQIHR